MTAAADVLSPRRRAAVLALWALGLALCALLIARTPFVADLSAFLPAQPDARQRVLIEQLQSGIAARTLFVAIEGGSAPQRAEASRVLATALRASGRFEQVHNGGNEGYEQIGRWLFEHRYLLSPGVTPQRFTPEGLREGIEDTLSLLGTPAGNALKALLERDPTGETQRIGEALIPTNAPRSEDGVWVSRDGLRAVLLANVAAAGADLDGQSAALDTLRGSFAQIAQATPGLTLKMSGTPMFSVESRARIEREAKMLAIVGTVLMSTLLWLAFASLPALFVALLPVATGVAAGVAAVGLGFGSVHGVTLAFGSTLIGETVDYAIYYLIQAGQAGSGGPGNTGGPGHASGWRHWVRNSWPTVRLGLLTSVCGFTALAFSGFPGLAQLGVFSTAGLVAAALATRYVLPVLMPQGAAGQGARRLLGRGAGAAVRGLPRLRAPLLVLGTAALVFLLWQRGALWQADLASLSPVGREALALDASLRADVSDTESGPLVVVQGPDIETALQRTEATAARLDAEVERGGLAGYSSVTRWLPSAATQQARRASLPEPEALRSALQQATAGGPLRAARLEPFIAEVQAARALPAITHAALHAPGSALAPLVDALLLQRRDGSWAALLPLQAAPGQPLDAALRQALEATPGVQVLDIKPELDRLYARYLGEAQAQTLLGALGVVLLMALWLRSPRRLLAVCQPLVLAVVLTLAGLALSGVQLGILHLVGLLLVVAVGSNYALFFDMLRQQPAGTGAGSGMDEDTLASLALANMTTVLSFGLIALSGIPALSAIGQVVAPGALLALLLAAAFARTPGTAQAA